jgi:hypothetical protein
VGVWFVGSFVSHVDRVLCHSSHLLVARAINTRVEPPPRLVLPTGLRYGFPSGRLIRRPAHSSRPLVAMSSAIQRLTVETMSVFTNESHAEAFREVGLEHLIGGETKLEFTTLGRSKRVESVCIIVGEPEARRASGSTSMFCWRSTSSRPCPSSTTTTLAPGSI